MTKPADNLSFLGDLIVNIMMVEQVKLINSNLLA